METGAKKRANRSTAEQYKLMLDFFGENKGLAEGKFVVLHGRQEAAKKWEELAGQLNAVGVVKTAKQWQVVWRDLKSRTSVKARERRKEMAATGGKPLSCSALTELDMRVLAILGAEYVEGASNCADSIPEEEFLQVCLKGGADEVLALSPTVPNIFDVETLEEVEVVDETPAKKRRTDRSMTSSQRRTVPKRTVLNSARQQFAEIAKQQADAMKMLAEAAKQQAETAALQAQTFARIASALEQLPTAISRAIRPQRNLSIPSPQSSAAPPSPSSSPPSQFSSSSSRHHHSS